MPQSNQRVAGWRGVSLVAITYVYFLIFAQFAFLKRLTELSIADAHLKAVMAAMAFGGILFSLLTPRTNLLRSPRLRLQAGLALCAAAALLTLLPLVLPASIAVAFLIGSGLGILTVTLVTHLRSWLGTGSPLLKVGIGPGLGYLICNFPPLFTATPAAQALTAAALCLAAIAIASKTTPDTPPEGTPARARVPSSRTRVTARVGRPRESSTSTALRSDTCSSIGGLPRRWSQPHRPRPPSARAEGPDLGGPGSGERVRMPVPGAAPRGPWPASREVDG